MGPTLQTFFNVCPCTPLWVGSRSSLLPGFGGCLRCPCWAWLCVYWFGGLWERSPVMFSLLPPTQTPCSLVTVSGLSLGILGVLRQLSPSIVHLWLCSIFVVVLGDQKTGLILTPYFPSSFGFYWSTNFFPTF